MKNILFLIFCSFTWLPQVLAQTDRPASWAQPVDVDGVPNLHKVTKSLYRSAQPTAEGMVGLKKLGIKTVVSLRSFHSDRKTTAAAKLKYDHIYMKTWHPEREDVVRFLKLATNPANTPLLVHCQFGADRTGTMVAVYRVVVEDWTPEDAVKEMTEGGYGFHEIWDNLPTWIRSLDIESLKRDSGVVPGEEMGKE